MFSKLTPYTEVSETGTTKYPRCSLDGDDAMHPPDRIAEIESLLEVLEVSPPREGGRHGDHLSILLLSNAGDGDERRTSTKRGPLVVEA